MGLTDAPPESEMNTTKESTAPPAATRLPPPSPAAAAASETSSNLSTSNPSVAQSRFRRRMSSKSLRVICDREPKEETVEEGEYLFENFLSEEVQREGLQVPLSSFTPTSSISHLGGGGDTPNTSTSLSTPGGYTHVHWAKAGKELRLMADAFAKTKEREKVRQKAGQLDIEAIEYEQFTDMLCELFLDGGFTKERILVLFFFCSDVAIRALKCKAINYFQRFLQWSLQYIKDKVCAWVEAHGGWGAVISASAVYLRYFAAGFGVITGIVVGAAIAYYFIRIKGKHASN